MRNVTWGLACIITLAGCGSSALRAAESGDHAKLRAEIAEKHQKGSLSNGEAASLARAVAEREIATAKDEKEALARLHETRACSAELDGVLADRMKTHDGAGAEAALARVEDGNLGDGRARDFVDDPDDRWRAVGTRTLHRDADAKRRRERILDPSPRVRRAALHASGVAQDPGDIDVLLETVRVDPELLLRNEALRAVSAILRSKDAKGRVAEVATKLRDLWTTGDDALREDIAVAWALAPVFENGGREALRVVIASEKGPGEIAAAGVVLRTAPKDKELADSAAGILARTIAEGSRRERAYAIVSARVDQPILLEALRKASKDEDMEVRVAALGRLMDAKSDRDAATKELETIAGYGIRGDSDDARLKEHASRARLALAYAGDARIQAWIEADLASADARTRASAASALAALGRAARAAPLLADADVSVRTRAACTLLVASRH